MKFDEWLTKIPIRQTPKGVRLDLRLYVYPDGHGNFCVENEAGGLSTSGQPVNNPTEAREVLEKLWNRAMSAKPTQEIAAPPQPTLANQFADIIGIAPDLPDDMASQHDHYVHGTPKS